MDEATVAVPAPSREITEKRCSRCGRVKPAKEFWRSKHHAGGLYCYCKSCACEDQNRRRGRGRRSDPDSIEDDVRVEFFRVLWHRMTMDYIDPTDPANKRRAMTPEEAATFFLRALQVSATARVRDRAALTGYRKILAQQRAEEAARPKRRPGRPRKSEVMAQEGWEENCTPALRPHRVCIEGIA